MVQGLYDEAKKRGISLLFFSGMEFKAHRYFKIYNNRLYELIDEAYLDELIIPVVMMGALMQEKYEEYLRRFSPIPMGTLSFKRRGCSVPLSYPFPLNNRNNDNLDAV